MKNTILVLPLLFFCFTAFSQKVDFTSGSYTNSNGEKFQGFIRIDDDDPAVLKFKTDKNRHEEISIPLTGIKSIQLDNDEYKIWYGKRSMTFPDKIEFKILNIDSFRTEAIPLKLIYKAPEFSLYRFKDVRERFFIEYGEKTEELLINYRYLTDSEMKRTVFRDSPTYTIFPVYRDQIFFILKDQATRKHKAQLEKTDYNQQSLTRLFRFLNGHLP